MPTVQIPGPINPAKFLLVAVIWLLIVFGFAGVTSGLNKQWTPPNGTANRGDQCEEISLTPGTSTGTVLEHENTWSNAGYLLAGLLVLFCTCRPLGYYVGAMLCVLAFLSGMYHGTLDPDWQNWDVASIYFILWALLLYALQATLISDRLFKKYFKSPWDSVMEWFIPLAVAGLSFRFALGMADLHKRVSLFGSTTVTFTFVTVLIVLCSFQMSRHFFRWGTSLCFWRLWTEPSDPPINLLFFWNMFWARVRGTDWHLRSYFWGFVVFGGIGVFCRLNDGTLTGGKPKLLCHPGWLIQPHAVWHVFGAVALLLTYDLFAWSAPQWDWPVLARGFPRDPKTRLKESKMVYAFQPIYVAALTSGIFGLALFGLSFSSGTFVDVVGGNEVAARNTGIVIAGFFLLFGLFGLVLFLLRLGGVIKDASPEA